MRDFSYALFDLDGTLLNSMHIWTSVDERFLQERGIAVPVDYALALSGLYFMEAAHYTIDRFHLDETPEQVLTTWHRMAQLEYARVGLKPHALSYLERLKAAGVKLAVATSLTRELYEPALVSTGIADYFDVIACAEEVGKGKGSPDLYLLTLERLGGAARDSIVFEDTLKAIVCANGIGMRTYALYDDSNREQWDEMQRVAHGALYDFGAAPMPY